MTREKRRAHMWATKGKRASGWGRPLFLSRYFQNSKLGVATVKSRRNLYFDWNEELAAKMTNFGS